MRNQRRRALCRGSCRCRRSRLAAASETTRTHRAQHALEVLLPCRISNWILELRRPTQLVELSELLR